MQLKVFGPPALLDREGREVSFRTRKQLALLIYLHFESRTHPVARDGLVDLLWPEAPSSKGRHSLSQALSAVRSRLGEGAITTRSETVGLVAPLLTELDALATGELAVVDLAEPVRDLDGCAGADFAHWVDGTRQQLLSMARERLAVALREARKRGDLAAVGRQAQLLHGVDPINPSATIALAERALLAGDTIGAIRLLREYLHRVERELHANPHPEIATLLRRLEQGGGPGIEATTPLVQMAQRRREVFVGREAELARLEGLWQRSREESLVSCMVTGVAGIGKSSLVRRFATSVAARTNPVFVVTCQEIGGGIPFAAVSDLMLAIARDPTAGGTDPIWLAEASRVAPGLRAVYPGIPEPPQAPAESVRLRVAEALVRMIDIVADRRPALIVFDDVQHMDPASRDVLFLFSRRLEQLRLLLLGTVRTTEGQRTRIGESAPESIGWHELIELLPLPEGHVDQLIAVLTPDGPFLEPRIRDTIAGFAQGNPYHVEMLVSDWRQHADSSLVAVESAGDATEPEWKPPETLRLAFAKQYKGLSSNAHHAVHLLAVAGKAVLPALLAELLRLSESLTETAILELLDRGLLRVDGGPIYFKNELHRAFVYYAMSSDARRYFHAKLAERSWQGWTSKEFQLALEASHHYARAGMRGEAVKAVISGAEAALTRGAPQEAKRALHNVLIAYPRDLPARLHLLLAWATSACGEYTATLDALAAWEPGPWDKRDQALAAQLGAEAMHRGRLGDERTIEAAALTARRLAEEANSEESLVRTLQIQAEAAFDAGKLQALDDVRSAAREASRASNSPECLALSRMTHGYCEWAAGHFDAAAQIFSGTATLFEELSLHVDYRRVLNGLGMSLTALGRFVEAEQVLQRTLRVAEQLGSPLAVSNTWFNLASLYLDMGRFQDAVYAYRMTITTSTPSAARILSYVYSGMAGLATVLGNLAEAGDYLDTSAAEAEKHGMWYAVATALLTRADLLLAQAMPEMAWPLVERARSVVNGREPLLPDIGQYERLQLHHVWVTKGYAAAVDAYVRDARQRCRRVIDQLELEAFMAWLASLAGDDQAAAGELIVSRVVSFGAYGVLARLIAVGVHVPGGPLRSPSESSAQLVARLFPAPERAHVPRSVGLVAPVAEPLRNA